MRDTFATNTFSIQVLGVARQPCKQLQLQAQQTGQQNGAGPAVLERHPSYFLQLEREACAGNDWALPLQRSVSSE